MEPLVSVTIVTYNSGRYIRECLESVRRQDYKLLEVVIVDNNSQDNSTEILESCRSSFETPSIKILRNYHNNGFCGGQNQAIQASRGVWVLALNPDVVLDPDFISRAIAGIESVNDPAVGMACGRLRSTQPGKLDSTGMYFTPSLRHFDRDGRREDTGQHQRMEYVFGATGAAALYSREMIAAVSPLGPQGLEFFDPQFFAYREDADLAWRAQLMGWNCLYVPDATGSHVRTCLPENRAQMNPLVNMHSVKNRFLMRIKNIGAGLYWRHFAAITLRDLCVLGYCVLSEQSSLPGLATVVREWRNTQAKRRWIQSRRRRSDAQLAAWFADEPVSMQVPIPASMPAAAMAAVAGPTGSLVPGTGRRS